MPVHVMPFIIKTHCFAVKLCAVTKFALKTTVLTNIVIGGMTETTKDKLARGKTPKVTKFCCPNFQTNKDVQQMKVGLFLISHII